MIILIRWAVAFVLLTLTYNPTQYNYVAWAQRGWQMDTPLIVLAGLVLAVGYVIYLRATLRSIGVVGMALVIALVAALIWVLQDYGLISLENPTSNIWLALVTLSGTLGVGLSWSIIRRRLSGQADVDDVDA
jgi:uncharacterized membrane protein YjgN (DUF898 family)